MIRTISCMLLVSLAAGAAWADDYPDVADVIGIDGVAAESWLAVRLDVPEGNALAGFAWYNNDGETTFPGAFVGTGHADGPGPLANMVTLAGPFSGDSSGWSELTFSEPVAASEAALYVVFAFPQGVPYEDRGAGGGPAIGYVEGDTGVSGWITGDGEFWMELDREFGFAVVPEFVPYEDGMLVKSLGDSGEETVDVVLTPYLRAGPNPFNPRTTLRFGLVSGGKAVIDVFDLRGRRIRRLHDGFLPAGHHVVAWRGRDDDGRGVSSGAYLVRLQCGGVEMKQRLLLVR